MILKIVKNSSKNKVIIPFYHAVENTPSNFVKNLYIPKNIDDFKNDLNVLLKYYKPISLEELILINQSSSKIKNTYFHLTFDDGLANFYHTVAPILLEKKIPATIFINTNFVNNNALFYRYKASLLIENFKNCNENCKLKYFRFILDYYKNTANFKAQSQLIFADIIPFILNLNFENRTVLDQLAEKIKYNFTDFLKTEKPYLTLTQIKELQKKGFTFGAHSENHPNYSEITLKEQLKQTKNSLLWVKNNLNVKFNTFSFPFSDIGVSNDFFEEIKYVLDLSFGTSGIKKSNYSYHLQRLDMEKNKTSTNFFLLKFYLKSLIKFVK